MSVSALRTPSAPAISGSPAALRVEHVTKHFGAGTAKLIAVEDISFHVAAGEFVSVIGPSGCGKSTLFHIIGGLIGDYQGRVTVAGEPVHGPHPAIGMVFQEESAFPWRNVIDNVAFPLELRGVGRAERLERAAHYVRLVGLGGFERRYPAELSGGMRQRVAIARTLTAQPKVMLMDEPFAALDQQTRLLLGTKVLELHNALRQTTLLITHSLTEAVQLSDRIVVMTFRPGRLRRILTVHLPHPRTDAALSSPEFGAAVAELWGDLREEASRGLSEGGALAKVGP